MSLELLLPVSHGKRWLCVFQSLQEVLVLLVDPSNLVLARGQVEGTFWLFGLIVLGIGSIALFLHG